MNKYIISISNYTANLLGRIDSNEFVSIVPPRWVQVYKYRAFEYIDNYTIGVRLTNDLLNSGYELLRQSLNEK